MKPYKAFYKARNLAGTSFYYEFIKMLKSIKYEMAENETRVIYIDNENSHDRRVLMTNHMIDKHMDWDIPYSKVYLVPEIKNEKMPGFPFSYEFVAQTLYHSLKKSDYQNNEDEFPMDF